MVLELSYGIEIISVAVLWVEITGTGSPLSCWSDVKNFLPLR